jgi:hypothetical protein
MDPKLDMHEIYRLHFCNIDEPGNGGCQSYQCIKIPISGYGPKLDMG